MARKKKAEQIATEEIEASREAATEWVLAVSQDLQNIVDTISNHAEEGNKLAEAVDMLNERTSNLTVEVSALRVLHQGARDDIKRERQAGAFGRDELLARIEHLEEEVSVETAVAHERLGMIEEIVYADKPTLWERVKAFFGGYKL